MFGRRSLLRRFNAANPGSPVTYSDLVRYARQQARAKAVGAGQPGRDPTLNRMLRLPQR